MTTRDSFGILFVLAILIGATTFTGCATFKGWVCDCADQPASAEDCPTPTEQRDRAVEVASLEVTSATRAASADTGNSAEASVREVDREKRSPQVDPHESIDPTIPDATVDLDEQADNLRNRYGIPEDIPEGAVGLTANFAGGKDRELALVEPGRRIRVYGSRGLIADLKFSTTAADVVPSETRRSGTSAVRLVRDGSAQILAHWSETDENGLVSYKVGAYKIIGEFVGSVFEKTLATRKKGADTFQLRGTYEFLHGKSHRYIRWIPADKSGTLTRDESTVLKWNRWEGVYRAPGPPPSAPDREEASSDVAPSSSRTNHEPTQVVGTLGLGRFSE